MTKYEFVFLLNQEDELKNLQNLVTSLSGKLLEEKTLGKKNLVYPIKKNSSANFYQWKLELEPSKLNELNKKLSFNDVLIRYLLLKDD